MDTGGRPWMVDDQNKIYRYDVNSNSWQMLPGLGVDIAAGGDGSIWVLGVGRTAGGYSIFKWDNTTQNWTAMSGAGVRIAVEKSGSPWVVNENGDIFRYDLQSGAWSRKPGKARSVHTGLSSGAVWMIGAEPIAGGYLVSQFVAATQTWEQYGTFGAVEMTEAAGTPWIVQKDGSIYSKTADLVSVPMSGTTTINTSLPPMTPQSQRLLMSPSHPARATWFAPRLAPRVAVRRRPTTLGSTLWTSRAMKASTTRSGAAPAGSVRKRAIKGPWLRSTSSIEKDDACWRVPKEKTGKATKTKSPAWAWECPSGSFHDLYSPDGWGGSCWKCPDSLPRRTGEPRRLGCCLCHPGI